MQPGRQMILQELKHDVIVQHPLRGYASDSPEMSTGNAQSDFLRYIFRGREQGQSYGSPPLFPVHGIGKLHSSMFSVKCRVLRVYSTGGQCQENKE